MVNVIRGKKDYIEYLRGKRATFLLGGSFTKTATIDGITQAGIPGLLDLTPILDSEFLCSGEVRSLENIAETPKGVPTPALITRAVHLKKPFSNIEILDLGLTRKPKLEYFNTHDFGITPSDRIDEDAKINAMELFQKGVEFGKDYECKDDYIILAESVPSGTTTARAVVKALDYDCDDMFSSSFKDAPKGIKDEVINKAISNIDSDDLFERIGKVSDNMIIFYAGFIFGNSYHSKKIVLAGGTQMAAVLLFVNAISKYMGADFDSSNLALCTTKWIYEDEKSDINSLLGLLDFPINAFYSDFDFSLANHPALKLYDEGEAKEGVGAGAALCYALINGVSKEEITKQVEEFLG